MSRQRFQEDDDFFEPPVPSSAASQAMAGPLCSTSESLLSTSEPLPEACSSQPCNSQATTSCSSQAIASGPALSQSWGVLPSDTVSVACRLKDLVPVKEKKRPRKPSPPRQRRPSSDEWLDRFLERGCGCASNCWKLFDREYYSLK